MAKRKVKKTIKAMNAAERLHGTLVKRTKGDLVDVLVEFARDDRNILRRLEARFKLQSTP
jgi:hypothetical protein